MESERYLHSDNTTWKKRKKSVRGRHSRYRGKSYYVVRLKFPKVVNLRRFRQMKDGISLAFILCFFFSSCSWATPRLAYFFKTFGSHSDFVPLARGISFSTQQMAFEISASQIPHFGCLKDRSSLVFIFVFFSLRFSSNGAIWRLFENFLPRFSIALQVGTINFHTRPMPVEICAKLAFWALCS